MGCAPSIHVQQSTGAVYCREDNSQEPTSNIATVQKTNPTSTGSLSISEVVSHLPPSTTVHRESLTTEVRITHFQGKRGSVSSLIATTSTHQAWTVEKLGEKSRADTILHKMEKVHVFQSSLAQYGLYFHEPHIGYF